MPAHLRPPDRHASRPLGVLAIALGIALLVFAGFSGGNAHDGTTQLVRPATETSTEPTVLGEDIERTSVPDAPPASAAGFTTTPAGIGSGDGPAAQPNGTTALNSPPPTIGAPTSVTRPPPPRPTTTTTAPTTTTTAPTTTTTDPTTTVVTTTAEASP